MSAKIDVVAPPFGGATTVVQDAAITRILDRTVDDLAFAFAHPEELESMSHDKSQIIRAVDKIAVETVLLLDTIVRAGVVSRYDERVQYILEECSKEIRSARNRFLFTHNPRLCTSFGLGHILLSGLGHEDEAFDSVLRAASASPALHPANKLPFRLLDDYWVLARAGIGVSAHQRPNLAEFTMLTAPISPLYYRTDDYYALTHEIMYLTDFGVKRLPQDYDCDYALGLIEAGILDNLRSYDLDVLAELVAASVMVAPNRLSSVAALAAKLLQQEFDQIDLLPSRNFDPDYYRAIEDPILQRCYLFFNTYHTTHVFGMMLAMLSRAGLRMPQSTSQEAELPEVVVSYLSERNENASGWLGRLAKIDLPDEDRAGVVLGVGLFDAVRRQDAKALFAILNYVKTSKAKVTTGIMHDLMEHLARISFCA